MAGNDFNLRLGARVVEAADRLAVVFGDGEPSVEEKMVSSGKEKRAVYRVSFEDGSTLDVPAGSADQFCEEVARHLRGARDVVAPSPGSGSVDRLGVVSDGS